MDIKIVALDFEKEWMNTKDSYVEPAMESLKCIVEDQEKKKEKRKRGIVLEVAVVMVTVLASILVIIASLPLITIGIIIMVSVILIFSIAESMIDFYLINEKDLKHCVSNLSGIMEELHTCAEMESIEESVNKFRNAAKDCKSDWWKTKEVESLLAYIQDLREGYNVTNALILDYQLTGSKEISITYADKDGYTHEITSYCRIKQNINIEKDTLTWKDGDFEFTKKYNHTVSE